MRLWTWQNKNFSLADEKQKVKIFEYSFYLNESRNCDVGKKHRDAYNEVIQILGTDQLIWFFTDYKDAISHFSEEEFVKLQNCLLWELHIPETKIHWYCEAAWQTLRTGKSCMPTALWEIAHLSEPLFPKIVKNYQDDFNSYWSGKSEDELLSLMFLKKPVLNLGLSNAREPRCSGAIVIHPVGKEKIIKNPLDIGNWWKFPDTQACHSPLNRVQCLVDKIPCSNCPGRS